MQNFVWTVLFCSCCCVYAFGQEPSVYSGPQPGEKLPKLEVVDAFKVDSEAFDVAARVDSKPGVFVIIHDMLTNKSDEPSLGLAYVLMHYAASREDADFQRSLVFLTDDMQTLEKFLTKVRRALPKKETPIFISTDGLDGPGSWGINRNLRMTVVIADRGKVVSNFALQQPSVIVDAPKILADLVELIGGNVPKLHELDFPYYIGKPKMESK